MKLSRLGLPRFASSKNRQLKGVQPEQKKQAQQLLDKFDRLETFLDQQKTQITKVTGQSGQVVSIMNGKLRKSGLESALGLAQSLGSFLSLGSLKNEDRLEQGILSGTGDFNQNGELSYLHVSCDQHPQNYGAKPAGWQELFSLHTDQDGTKTYSLLGENKEMLIVAADGKASYLGSH